METETLKMIVCTPILALPCFLELDKGHVCDNPSLNIEYSIN